MESQIGAGRAGDPPSVEMAEDIADKGLTVERFKTGTPPRIDGRTVNFARLERQDGDLSPYWFSAFARGQHPAQRPCFLTYTTELLRDIITEHLSESAMYGGAIGSRGPRYCPSIEDKIVRFPNASRHQVFLEPEGLETTEMYVNGLSTSLPPAVQLEYLRSVPGLEAVEMTRPGYAIEYDYYPPTQLERTLAVKSIRGLYFAGQINGTTGYEEAAGQGIVAGLNAALFARERSPVTIGRNEAYLGVLIDDLVTKGVDEPYRLFTSRSEFRLLLRQDNALRRLYPLANRLGLLSDAERRVAESRLASEERVADLAVRTVVAPDAVADLLTSAGERRIAEPVRVAELARRPGLSLSALLDAGGVAVSDEEAQWAEIEIRYAGYMEREQEMATRLTELESFALPSDAPYRGYESLSFEAREKLHRHRPTTLGQASRIPGVSPSDLHCLVMEILRVRV
jgi:tRNA uridine 5-carboxymethylaminomethyl modification enzyme